MAGCGKVGQPNSRDEGDFWAGSLYHTSRRQSQPLPEEIPPLGSASCSGSGDEPDVRRLKSLRRAEILGGGSTTPQQRVTYADSPAWSAGPPTRTGSGRCASAASGSKCRGRSATSRVVLVRLLPEAPPPHVLRLL